MSRLQMVLNWYNFKVIDKYFSLEQVAKNLQKDLEDFGSVLDAMVLIEEPNYLKVFVKVEPFGDWVRL